MGGLVDASRVSRSLSQLTLLTERNPSRVRFALDATTLIALVLAFGQVWDPDVLFHVTWTALALQAFTSASLRANLFRIAIAFGCLVGYWLAQIFFTRMAQMEIAEWPLMLLISIIVALMAERRRTTSRRYAELYRRTSDRLLTMQEIERKLLATDLHDGVGQALSSLALTLEAAEQRLPIADPVRESIAMSRELIASASDETRAVAGRLQPARLEQRGLLGAVRELCKRAGLPVHVDLGIGCEAALAALPGPVQVQLFRIVQEAIANAVRHSSAKTVVLSFELARSSIAVAVMDDGRGLDLAEAHDQGLGLAGMHDRANAIGGDLRITSALGEGTKVCVTLALPRETEVGVVVPSTVGV